VVSEGDGDGDGDGDGCVSIPPIVRFTTFRATDEPVPNAKPSAIVLAKDGLLVPETWDGFCEGEAGGGGLNFTFVFLEGWCII
tara:strand:- start:260 stop:508 length:249 start_codon:yes stop_codon:yes gene_type:complete